MRTEPASPSALLARKPHDRIEGQHDVWTDRHGFPQVLRFPCSEGCCKTFDKLLT